MKRLIAASIFAVLPVLALAADNPDWAYPVTPRDRAASRRRHSQDAARKQQAVHAGADRRPVQSA